MFWESDPRFDLVSGLSSNTVISCVLIISGWLIILQSGHNPIWYQVFSSRTSMLFRSKCNSPEFEWRPWGLFDDVLFYEHRWKHIPGYVHTALSVISKHGLWLLRVRDWKIFYHFYYSKRPSINPGTKSSSGSV